VRLPMAQRTCCSSPRTLPLLRIHGARGISASLHIIARLAALVPRPRAHLVRYRRGGKREASLMRFGHMPLNGNTCGLMNGGGRSDHLGQTLRHAPSKCVSRGLKPADASDPSERRRDRRRLRRFFSLAMLYRKPKLSRRLPTRRAPRAARGPTTSRRQVVSLARFWIAAGGNRQ
jgi:hypothetical protein